MKGRRSFLCAISIEFYKEFYFNYQHCLVLYAHKDIDFNTIITLHFLTLPFIY